MSVYGNQLHQPGYQPQAPQAAQACISVAELALIGSVISLIGGFVLTAAAVIAYNNSLQQNTTSNEIVV